MKKFVFACVIPVITLTGCGGGTLPSGGRALDNVEMMHPKVSLTFLDSGKKYSPNDTFLPPKAIDCSGLTLKSDSFKDAIEAGALLVKLQTPTKINQTIIVKDDDGNAVKDKDGNDVQKTITVRVKPNYGGVLALCKVSERATGPDSRSYRIRGLDKYLIRGKDGFVSVIGAVLNHKKPTKTGIGIIDQLNSRAPSNFSWMLWMSDRMSTFTNYADEVSRRRVEEARRKAEEERRKAAEEAAKAKES